MSPGETTRRSRAPRQLRKPRRRPGTVLAQAPRFPYPRGPHEVACSRRVSLCDPGGGRAAPRYRTARPRPAVVRAWSTESVWSWRGWLALAPGASVPPLARIPPRSFRGAVAPRASSVTPCGTTPHAASVATFVCARGTDASASDSRDRASASSACGAIVRSVARAGSLRRATLAARSSERICARGAIRRAAESRTRRGNQGALRRSGAIPTHVSRRASESGQLTRWFRSWRCGWKCGRAGLAGRRTGSQHTRSAARP